uniref:Uncharacterized protein n=1 Tax=Arundo donax TaxID=35708 RepID=A0A0A9BWH8_ARUDO
MAVVPSSAAWAFADMEVLMDGGIGKQQDGSTAHLAPLRPRAAAVSHGEAWGRWVAMHFGGHPSQPRRSGANLVPSFRSFTPWRRPAGGGCIVATLESNRGPRNELKGQVHASKLHGASSSGSSFRSGHVAPRGVPCPIHCSSAQDERNDGEDGVVLGAERVVQNCALDLILVQAEVSAGCTDRRYCATMSLKLS